MKSASEIRAGPKSSASSAHFFFNCFVKRPLRSQCSANKTHGEEELPYAAAASTLIFFFFLPFYVKIKMKFQINSKKFNQQETHATCWPTTDNSLCELTKCLRYPLLNPPRRHREQRPLHIRTCCKQRGGFSGFANESDRKQVGERWKRCGGTPPLKNSTSSIYTSRSIVPISGRNHQLPEPEGFFFFSPDDSLAARYECNTPSQAAFFFFLIWSLKADDSFPNTNGQKCENTVKHLI